MKSMSKLFLMACMCCLALAASGAVTINELRNDQTGTDNDEYFELTGTPSESLNGMTFLVLGDGAGGTGTIESVTDLTGYSIPGDGYFLVTESSFGVAVTGSAEISTASLNFENSDTFTYMVVSGFTGALNDDLDTNDDGTLDVTPWTTIVDSVAILHPTSTELPYSATQVVADGSFSAGHIYRFPNATGPWYIGPFDPGSGNDSAGVANGPLAQYDLVTVIGSAAVSGEDIDGDDQFATIQAAINSFRAGAPNNAFGGANQIDVDANGGPFNEALRLNDSSGVLEDLAFVGQNGRPVVQLQLTVGGDGFNISSNSNFAFTDMVFVPSSTSTPTDDLFFWERLAVGGPSELRFTRCALTSADAGGNPVADTFAKAKQNLTANIATSPGDDFITISMGSLELSSLVFVDSVISHGQQVGSGRDAIVDVSWAADSVTPMVHLYRSIISYNTRYGLQCSGSGLAGGIPVGSLADEALYLIEGDATTPTLIVNNLRGIQSFFGPNYGTLQIENAVIGDNTERNVSLDAGIGLTTMNNSALMNSGVGFVFDDNFVTTPTITNSTFHNNGLIFLVDGSVPGLAVNISDTIFTDSNSNDVLIDTFLTPSPWDFNIDFSAIVTTGGERIGGLGITGYENLGGNIVNDPPAYVSTVRDSGSAINPDLFDVQSMVYAGAGTAASNLSGYGDYVGGVATNVPDWMMHQ